MDENAFQKWMDDVCPALANLSMEQTSAFFTAFVDGCSMEQRIFIASELRFLFARDIMKLPSVVVDKIFRFLSWRELLKLRVVCRSWKDIVEARSWVWRRQCDKYGTEIRTTRCLSRTLFFRMFVSVMSVVKRMKNNKAFEIKSFPVLQRSIGKETFTVNHIAYGNNLIVAESYRLLVVMNARTKEVLRKHEEFGHVSSLLVSGGLVLAGGSWGQLKVLAWESGSEHEIQVGVNTLKSLAVHSSGHFLLAGFVDGSVRLVDNNLEIFTLDLKIPMEDEEFGEAQWRAMHQKVYFWSDTKVGPGELVVCVCRLYSWTLAVITFTGKVVHQYNRTFESRVQTSCRSSANPYLLHCELQTACKGRPLGCQRVYRSRLVSFFICCNSKGVSSRVITHSSSKLDAWEVVTPEDATYLLAVGRRLALSAHENNLIVFRPLCGEVVCVIRNFFERYNIWRLYLNRGLTSMVAMDLEWLDGLSPSTTTLDQPIFVFGTAENMTLKFIEWSKDLWQDSLIVWNDVEDSCKYCCDIFDEGFLQAGMDSCDPSDKSGDGGPDEGDSDKNSSEIPDESTPQASVDSGDPSDKSGDDGGPERNREDDGNKGDSCKNRGEIPDVSAPQAGAASSDPSDKSGDGGPERLREDDGKDEVESDKNSGKITERSPQARADNGDPSDKSADDGGPERLREDDGKDEGDSCKNSCETPDAPQASLDSRDPSGKSGDDGPERCERLRGDGKGGGASIFYKMFDTPGIWINAEAFREAYSKRGPTEDS